MRRKEEEYTGEREKEERTNTGYVAFGDRLGEFHAIGADVIAVSVDSKFSHLAWTNQPRSQGGLGKISLPLVSDITKVYPSLF